MPRMNIDAESSKICKPIEFTLDGVDYSIDTVESGDLEALVDNGGNLKVIRDALTSLVGADADVFKKTDTRRLMLTVQYVVKEVTGSLSGLESKNVPKESAAKKA